MDRWSITQAHKYVDEIARELIAAEKRVVSLSESLSGGKILPMKPYKMVETFYQRSWNERDWTAERVEALYAEDLAIIEENEAAAKNNEHIYKTLYEIFKGLGFPEEITERVSSRSLKTHRVPAGWICTLRAIRKNTNSKQVHDIRESVLKRLAERDAEAQRKREREAAERKRESDRIEGLKYIGTLEAKYQQTFANHADAIDYLLSKDQHLRLAYYMEKNRGDWSDGTYYAEIGLEGFDPKTDTDKEIYIEIMGLVHGEDFDDGRIFRDCTWNYNVLYGMANQELLAEVRKIQEYFGRPLC